MKLLFICTHNRCRSILAEAITNHIAGSEINALSAGSSPQGEVHPMSLKFLAEHKVPIKGLQSQSWDQFENFAPDAIVTLCDSAAEETCPIWFDKSAQVHWGLADPSKADLTKPNADESDLRQKFNTTISILERRVRALLDTNAFSLKGEPLRGALRQIAAQVD